MRGVVNQHRLLGRLLATLAASALTGAGCSGASFEEKGDGAAGAGDDEGGSGGLVTVGGSSSGGDTAGDTSLGGTGNVGQGGASGVTNRGGTGAYAGDASDGGTGGTAGTGDGGTFGGAGANTGGVAGSVAGSGGTVAGKGGAGGSGASCGCPTKCYEWNVVPQNMGGVGGAAASDRIIAAGAPAGVAGGSGAPIPCPPASLVSMAALCGGTTPPPSTGPVITGPTFVGTTCCYAVAAACVSGGAGGVPGRPFLVEREARVAGADHRDDWTLQSSKTPELSEGARERLARAWLDDALLEHASVAAFARFTLELLSLGAPPELVQASGAAALDEIEHAKLCFAAASRYAGRALGPGKLDVKDAVGSTNFVAFALRTFEEGCVGETLAALLAEEALDRASDPFVRSVLERIASDEARHAELAWRAVHWAISSGGPTVVQALERAFVELRERESLAASCADDADDEAARADAWQAHGRLTPSEARKLRRQGLLGVVVPCFESLVAQFGCPPRSTLASPESRPERSLPL
jgi:hypothetical protein